MGSLQAGLNDTLVALIPKEAMHTMREKKGETGFMAIKLDLEKAYDRLSWDFIRDTLECADDMVLFTEATLEQVDVILDCFGQFCTASGQKISLSKSQVFFSKNTNKNMKEEISRRLRIESTEDLGKYLGVPAIHGRVTSATHSDLLARISSRLDGWKAKTLSLAGRVVLARSVLNAIPAYTMQTTFLPKGICTEIEKRTRNFIWGGTGTDNKMSLANWDLVTTATEAGGLGLKRMHELNLAYMAKLGWRLLAESESLWAQTINAKYRKSEIIHNMRQGRRNVSNAWRGISAAWTPMSQGVSRVVRSGATTRFWMDKWILPEPLSITLKQPSLYQNYMVWSGIIGMRYGDGSQVEDLQHLFRDCSAVKGLWEVAIPRSTYAKLSNLSWDQWLETNLDGNIRNGFDEDCDA
ncbi:PREDICTED: uncharacterized protein LOC109171271 [Ipomoea nil]|uniref:uncharacterized protein LOC109171271 n=1 Tax=Ipomoea nil TaxID=35883 RepID=UPI000900BB81|nr:PREDICTED: uncharacterized protein LOC109171271 [Ipomoea nil]